MAQKWSREREPDMTCDIFFNNFLQKKEFPDKSTGMQKYVWYRKRGKGGILEMVP